MASALADLKTAVKTAFTQRYGTAPSHIAHAPGRVNIIGEHTDYNEGFVLPAAMDRAIYIAAKARNDDTVNILSLDYNGDASFTLGQLKEKGLPDWTAYPRGALWVLKDKGHKIHGMDLVIAGNVPLGGGFSSSAAVEVAMFEVG